MRSKKIRIVATGSFLSLLAVVVAFRKGSAASSLDLSSVVTPAAAAAAQVPAAAPAIDKPATPSSALFTYTNKPANAARVENLMAVPSHDVHYAQIDTSLVGGSNSPIAKQGAQVEVALPDGTRLPVQISKTQSLGDDRYVSEGVITGSNEGRAVFAYNHGELSASIDDISHGSWQIRSMGNSISQVYKVDAKMVPPCEATTKQLAALKPQTVAAHAVGGDEWSPPAGAGPGNWKVWPNGWKEWVETQANTTPVVNTPQVTTTDDSDGPAGAGPGSWKVWPNGWKEWIPSNNDNNNTQTTTTQTTPTNTWTETPTQTQTQPTTPEPAAPTPQVSWGGTQIRILVAYSKALENNMSSSAIRSQIDLAIATLNNDFSRSGVPVTAVLAGAPAIQYNQEWDSSSGAVLNALSRLANAADGIMDEIHIMRGETNADLVCFLTAQNDPGNSGVGYILGSPNDVFNPTFGFSVVNFWYLNSNSTFSHEIGHNLGCNHDRENARGMDGNVATGSYSYSYGYRFYGRDGQMYRTIMAYAPGNVLPYFSNPNIWAWAPISAPVGVQPGQPGEAYNALTITQNATEVSYYHTSGLVTRLMTRLRGW